MSTALIVFETKNSMYSVIRNSQMWRKDNGLWKKYKECTPILVDLRVSIWLDETHYIRTSKVKNVNFIFREDAHHGEQESTQKDEAASAAGGTGRS